MKKIAVLTMIAIMFSSIGNILRAQAFKEGTNSLNLGIGLVGGYSYSGYSGISQSPALSAYYERGVKVLGPGVLGIGGGLEYRNLKYDYGFGSYSAKWTYSIIGLRGTYHPDFAMTDKFDGYAGLALGYAVVSYTDTYYNYLDISRKSSYPSYFYSSFFLGGRYLFSDKVGGFAEIGSGLTVLKIGVNLHF